MDPGMANFLRATGRGLALLLGALAAFVSGAWGALALWYQLPGGGAVRTLGAMLWAVLVLALFAIAILRRTWWPLGGYALAYALLLSDAYGFDIQQIVLDKIARNEEKYPVDKARGSAKKYNEL